MVETTAPAYKHEPTFTKSSSNHSNKPLLLAQYETQAANKEYRQFQESWIAFTKRVRSIKDSGIWKELASTWKEYVDNHLDCSYSELRQFMACEETADAIEAITNNPPTKTQALTLIALANQVIPKEERDSLRTDVISAILHNRPTEPIEKRHMQASYEVHKQALLTGRVLDSNDAIVSASKEAVLEAVDIALNEADMRYMEHKTGQWQKVAGRVVRDGAKVVVDVIGLDNLPDGAEVFVSWKA